MIKFASARAFHLAQPRPKCGRGREPLPDPERHLRDLFLLPTSAVPRAEQSDAVRATALREENPIAMSPGASISLIDLYFEVTNLSPLDLVLDRMLVEVWFGQPTFNTTLLRRHLVRGRSHEGSPPPPNVGGQPEEAGGGIHRRALGQHPSRPHLPDRLF